MIDQSLLKPAVIPATVNLPPLSRGAHRRAGRRVVEQTAVRRGCEHVRSDERGPRRRLRDALPVPARQGSAHGRTRRRLVEQRGVGARDDGGRERAEVIGGATRRDDAVGDLRRERSSVREIQHHRVARRRHELLVVPVTGLLLHEGSAHQRSRHTGLVGHVVEHHRIATRSDTVPSGREPVRVQLGERTVLERSRNGQTRRPVVEHDAVPTDGDVRPDTREVRGPEPVVVAVVERRQIARRHGRRSVEHQRRVAGGRRRGRTGRREHRGHHCERGQNWHQLPSCPHQGLLRRARPPMRRDRDIRLASALYGSGSLAVEHV